jgi:hypothetical protein
VDLSEFVYATCLVGGFTKTGVVDFIFQLYDADGDGRLDKEECKQMVENLGGVAKGEGDKERYKQTAFDPVASGAFRYANNTNNALGLFGDFASRVRKDQKKSDESLPASEQKGEWLEIGEFASFVHAMPQVFYPAYRLQQSIQKATLGLKRWAEVIKETERKARAVQEVQEVLEAKRMLGQEVTEEDQRKFMRQKIALG